MPSDQTLEDIELLCVDVDGVMTDGSIAIDDHGLETKCFHVRDGTGIRIWIRMGFQLALITGRTGMSLRHRASELGIRHVIQGTQSKQESFGQLLQQLSLNASQVAVLGDDLPDVPMMRLAGYPMAVADAVHEVQQLAQFVTILPGGRGAVREAIEHLLKGKQRWDEAVALFG